MFDTSDISEPTLGKEGVYQLYVLCITLEIPPKMERLKYLACLTF